MSAPPDWTVTLVTSHCTSVEIINHLSNHETTPICLLFHVLWWFSLTGCQSQNHHEIITNTTGRLIQVEH